MPRLLLYSVFVLLASGCTEQPPPAPVTSAIPARAQGDAVEPVGGFQEADQTEFVPLQMPATEPPLVEQQPLAAEAIGNVSAATRVRLADDRPEINEARLQQAGIGIYRGQRLVVLSDLPVQQVSGLPQLADRLFEALEAYYGPLPAAADGTPFQVTGYIIEDEEKFRQAALMPSAAFTFEHGKHLNYEFWIFNRREDYYRRHLALHEFTHCFMTCESGMHDIPPLWYIEGMAEYFATHRQAGDPAKDVWEFGLLPDRFEGFEGWGRISEFRRAFARSAVSSDASIGRVAIAPLLDVMPDSVPVFDSGFQYSSSWALCWLLNHHPEYRESMKSLAGLKHRDEFIDQAWAFRKSVEPGLSIDWLLFAESLQEGFDINRAFPKHHETPISFSSLSDASPAEFQLLADRGWQDSGLRMKRGQTVLVSCSGKFSVHDQPKKWVSEPNGVSIEYVGGLPLGQVVAVLVNPDGTKVTRRISVGESAGITAPFEASLWLQVNDICNSRSGNSGEVDVTLVPAR